MTDINSIKVSGTTYTLVDSVARNKVTTGTAVPTSASTAGNLYVRNTPSYPSGYIQISTPAELVAFATRVNAGETSLNACLTADIDMTGVSFTPIGNITNNYQGNFDGYGHVISNLSMRITDDTSCALFGSVSGDGAFIRNIGCDGFDIYSLGYVGALIGDGENVSVSNCYAYNCTLESLDYGVGGLLGSPGTLTISNCYTNNCTLKARYGNMVV